MFKTDGIFLDNFRFLRIPWVILFSILGIAALIATIAIPLYQLDRHYSQVNCRNFASQTNRQTKWVKYSFWNFDCLTPTSDGRWIPVSNLREFGGK